MTDGEREWGQLCRAAGWLLVGSGIAPLGWLGCGYIQVRWELVGSADIATTYWFLLAAVLGPCAAGLVAVGAWLVRQGRRATSQ